MAKSRHGAARAMAALIIGSLGLTACSSGQEATDNPDVGGQKTGPITIAYLQKQGDQQYFVDEAAGATDAAKELGEVKVSVVNLGLDSNKAISELDAAIARGVDGIAIVAPDQQIGPQVIDKAKQAGIPLVASDDSLKDGSGAEAPFVGFDGPSMGQEVGKKAGELYKQAGWTAADTRIIAAWKQDLTVCTDRVNGAKGAFTEAAGGDVPQIIEVGTDNTPTGAQDKAGAVITANQNVKHWVVWGCNDENVTGVVTALQNSGKKPADIIGVGLGAYLSCKDWKAGQQTGNRAALFIDGREVGASAIRALVESIRSGNPLPAKSVAKTTMVDATNWEQAGLACT
ncbi:substrate-binding domain-containing protein [Rhizomonospora bruguierae]|uniref:substrate-binding domain-containing protein n=1 Tax=Rhizomonospora bruguierae TaxID=1581705 RepID=UPI001BCF4F60|nr:substrate-binding domain-containing protein [Micromonospora sp. NBRC 107566]